MIPPDPDLSITHQPDNYQSIDFVTRSLTSYKKPTEFQQNQRPQSSLQNISRKKSNSSDISLSASLRDGSSSPESFITSSRHYQLKSFNKPIFLTPKTLEVHSVPTFLQEPKSIILSLNGSLNERTLSPDETTIVQSTKTSV